MASATASIYHKFGHLFGQLFVIRRSRPFPWKIFWQFFALESLVIIFFGVIFYAGAMTYLGHQAVHVAGGLNNPVSVDAPHKAPEISTQIDLSEVKFIFRFYIVAMFFVMLAIALWVARTLFVPLGELIDKASSLTRPSDLSGETNIAEEDLESSEPGELSDLASALDKAKRALDQKEAKLLTDRTEAEAIMTSISEAVLAVNRDGFPLFFNPQFAVSFGTKDLRLRKARLSDLFRSPEILNTFAETLSMGKAHTIVLSIFRGDLDANRHYSLSVAPLRSKDDNSIYGAIGVFYDISDLKMAEQIRYEFVSNASHELRTPITSIKGYTDILIEDLKSERYSEALKFSQVISKNVERLSLLVNDILDLSSLESGTDVRISTVDTREITEQALHQLDQKRSRKDQNIVTFFGVNQLEADPKRVEQVLVNLVENAIKYIPEGGRINVRWEAGQGRETYLKVSDDGPGIPKEHQERLFERFYRLEADRNSETGGTGLGLAIVKHIMQRHGGKVTVRSEGTGMDVGTEFSCLFP